MISIRGQGSYRPVSRISNLHFHVNKWVPEFIHVFNQGSVGRPMKSTFRNAVEHVRRTTQWIPTSPRTHVYGKRERSSNYVTLVFTSLYTVDRVQCNNIQNYMRQALQPWLPHLMRSVIHKGRMDVIINSPLWNEFVPLMTWVLWPLRRPDSIEL